MQVIKTAKVYLAVILITAIAGSISPDVHAQGAYIIELKDIEAYQDQPILPTKPLDYDIEMGFGKIEPFKFTLSSLLIDFGPLSPTNPVIRTNTLSVDASSSQGFSVITQENNSPQAGNNIIPDTSCDAGPCTEETSGKWDSILAYGLGYRCDPLNPCVAGFEDKAYFKQFANISLGEEPQTIISGAGNESATITYKLNIAGTQPSGTYSNNIFYIAIPSY